MFSFARLRDAARDDRGDAQIVFVPFFVAGIVMALFVIAQGGQEHWEEEISARVEPLGLTVVEARDRTFAHDELTLSTDDGRFVEVEVVDNDLIVRSPSGGVSLERWAQENVNDQDRDPAGTSSSSEPAASPTVS